ncbi:hypothetical protein RJT34_05387 [Clitoria ternatea]|uniref:Uncharacterized protein n=1 Tax=Clitoria ternatea TaxID=43366 RepID=A0AAN9K0K8_CLITE
MSPLFLISAPITPSQSSLVTALSAANFSFVSCNHVAYYTPAFGSLCHFLDNQFHEITHGIDASGHGFIWVVLEKKGKEKESEEEKEKWLPKGFEERNREKGMVIRQKKRAMKMWEMKLQ